MKPFYQEFNVTLCLIAILYFVYAGHILVLSLIRNSGHIVSRNTQSLIVSDLLWILLIDDLLTVYFEFNKRCYAIELFSVYLIHFWLFSI